MKSEPDFYFAHFQSVHTNPSCFGWSCSPIILWSELGNLASFVATHFCSIQSTHVFSIKSIWRFGCQFLHHFQIFKNAHSPPGCWSAHSTNFHLSAVFAMRCSLPIDFASPGAIKANQREQIGRQRRKGGFCEIEDFFEARFGLLHSTSLCRHSLDCRREVDAALHQPALLPQQQKKLELSTLARCWWIRVLQVDFPEKLDDVFRLQWDWQLFLISQWAGALLLPRCH